MALNRYQTLEFFRDVRRALTPEGVFVTGLSGQATPGHDALRRNGTVLRTLGDVFPNVATTPGDHHLFICENTTFGTLDSEVLRTRYRKRGVMSPHFTEYHFDLLLPAEDVRLTKEALDAAAASETERNRDLRPFACFLSLLLWERMQKPSAEGILHSLGVLQVWWISLPVGLLIVGALLARVGTKSRTSHRAGRYGILVFAAAVGLAGMALEVILLFAIQCGFGYLYQAMGAVFALFMGGMVLGPLVVRRIPMVWTFHALILHGFVTAVTVLLVPALIELILAGEAGSVLAVLGALTGWTGFLVGAAFPLLSGRYVDLSGKVGRAAGAVYGADLSGACAGALVVSTVLIPLWGVAATCHAVASLLFSAILALALGARDLCTAGSPGLEP